MIATAWQRVEGGIVFLAVIGFLAVFGVDMPWWAAILVFFAPDLSFAAYARGPRVGALAYNAVHIYGTGASLGVLGLLTGHGFVVSVGALWVAHAGLDRAFGYGLKSPEGFKVTHLGPL